MKKLITAGIAGLALTGAATAADTVRQAHDRPNILFLFSDDHATQSISAYGSIINKTPNIDRIAKEGALFKNNFCANSICGPSRACILTGKHSHVNGFMTNGNRFDGKQVTFPKLLQKVGYKTAVFGKWHLGTNPIGFDEWMVYPGQGSYHNPDYITPKGRKRLTGYSVEVTTDLALDFLKRNKKDKPFMLMCQFKAPHRTWCPGKKYLNMFDDVTIPVPDTFFDDYGKRAGVLKAHRMGIAKHMRMAYDLFVPHTGCIDWRRMNDDQKKTWAAAWEPKNKAFKEAKLTGKKLALWKYQRYVKNYLRCVQAVDDNVGRILKYLDDTGLAKNTIVVYSSDQGFYLGEHGWFDKRWMYEESFRMPLVMRWPGKLKPGTVIEQLTQNIDFAPTFLQAAGVEIPKEIQGESLVSIIDNPDAEWRTSLYYHYYEHMACHGVPRHYGIRTDRYKLIHYYTTNEWDLMDLKKDPKELQSFYDNPEYKGIREKLHAELLELKKKYKNPYNDTIKDPSWERQANRKKKPKKTKKAQKNK